MVQLTVSTRRVLRATFTNESGQLLYKTTHPRYVVLGTTTLHKTKPNDDPMDMCDHFDVIGEIEWHMMGSTKFRFDGKETPANEFLAPRGVLRRTRIFTGPDGCRYKWDMLLHDRLVLTRDDDSQTEVARYHRGSLGIAPPRRKPRLEVNPDVEHMLDLIVLTFVYVQKVHTRKQGKN